MSIDPSRVTKWKGAPPDPGDRSRYLIRCIAIACIVLALVAVFILFRLHSDNPSNGAGHQPNGGSGGETMWVGPIAHTTWC